MSQSTTTIWKEILKKEHAKSPLGILEKKLRQFYEELARFGVKLPEDIAKQIFDIRDENEKAQMKYIEDSQRRDREMVDKILLDSMTKELEVINKYQSTTK